MRRLACLLGCLASFVALAAAPAPLTVHFFDVGQGDSALIISPTGKTVLVDGGPPEAGAHVAARVKALTRGQPIDLVVLSHPHRDHLGGVADAIRAVGAKAYLDPQFDHPSDGYKDLLGVVGKSVEKVLAPADPERPQELSSIGIGGDAKIWLLWPRVGPKGEKLEPFLEGTRSDPNSNSIVFKLVYGKTAFLFVGDAEPDTEDYLIQKNIDFTSTVLKVGHHGGRHSSTSEFLEKVKPRAAVISVAAQNDYGHPGRETLARLADAGATIFRTDENGEVVATSDGETVTITPAHGKTVAKISGEVKPEVATGPIVAGERRLSKASLEARERYGHGGSSASPPAQLDVQPAKAVRSAPPEGAQYIASRRSRVFHKASCPAVAAIKDANRVLYGNREDAAGERKPAEDCNP